MKIESKYFFQYEWEEWLVERIAKKIILIFLSSILLLYSNEYKKN